MQDDWIKELQIELTATKAELEQRLRRIHEHHRRPLESDSKEQATQLENQEVVDALGNEARLELKQVSLALAKIRDGEFGFCEECGDSIGRNRLLAYPHARKCIDCAELDEDMRRVTG